MIGIILKYMRKMRKYKQADLAKRLNIGQTTLSGWERGFREPNSEMVFKIADVCDFEILIKDKLTGEIYTKDEIKRKDVWLFNSKTRVLYSSFIYMINVIF